MKQLIIASLLAAAVAAQEWHTCPKTANGCDCGTNHVLIPTSGANTCFETKTGQAASGVCAKDGTLSVVWDTTTSTICGRTGAGAQGSSIVVPHNTCGYNPSAVVPQPYVANTCPIIWDECTSSTVCTSLTVGKCQVSTRSGKDAMTTCNNDGSLTVQLFDSVGASCRASTESTKVTLARGQFRYLPNEGMYIRNNCPVKFETCAGGCGVSCTGVSTGSCSSANAQGERVNSKCEIDGSLTLSNCDTSDATKAWVVKVPFNQCLNLEPVADKSDNIPSYVVNHCPVQVLDECAFPTVNTIAAPAGTADVSAYCFEDSTGKGNIATCTADGHLVAKKYSTSDCSNAASSTITVSGKAFGSPAQVGCFNNYCPTKIWAVGCNDANELAANGLADDTCEWNNVGICTVSSETNNEKLIGTCNSDSSLTITRYTDAECTVDGTVIATVPGKTVQLVEGKYVKNLCGGLVFSSAPATTSIVAASVAVIAAVLAFF